MSGDLTGLCLYIDTLIKTSSKPPTFCSTIVTHFVVGDLCNVSKPIFIKFYFAILSLLCRLVCTATTAHSHMPLAQACIAHLTPPTNAPTHFIYASLSQIRDPFLCPKTVLFPMAHCYSTFCSSLELVSTGLVFYLIPRIILLAFESPNWCLLLLIQSKLFSKTKCF